MKRLKKVRARVCTQCARAHANQSPRAHLYPGVFDNPGAWRIPVDTEIIGMPFYVAEGFS